MRSTPLLFIILPLLGTGWVSLEARPESSVMELQPTAVSHAPEEPSLVMKTAATPRASAVERPTLEDEEPVASPLLSDVELEHSDLPLLPINPLLEEDATPERYSEWYRGTSTEQLTQSLFRLNSIRIWDPKTCACADSELSLQTSATHERVHELLEQKDLLLAEGRWLAKEIRRKVRADLASGGSLMVFRMSQSKEGMKSDLEGSSKEELWILGHLLMEAQLETRRVAVEAAFAAGHYKVDASSPWG